MDPLEQVLVHHDTTFALMLAAQPRGHRLLSFGQEALFHQGGRCTPGHARCEVLDQQGQHFRSSPSTRAAARRARRGVDAEGPAGGRGVPPRHAAGGGRRRSIPALRQLPAGLRDGQREALGAPLPGADPGDAGEPRPRAAPGLRATTPKEGAIVKPVDGHGGEGVVLLRRGDRNTPSVLELLTARGRDWVVAQEYVPALAPGRQAHPPPRRRAAGGHPPRPAGERTPGQHGGGRPAGEDRAHRARPGDLPEARARPPPSGAGLRRARRHRRLPHRGERHQPHRAGRAGAARRRGPGRAKILAHVERLAADRREASVRDGPPDVGAVR